MNEEKIDKTGIWTFRIVLAVGILLAILLDAPEKEVGFFVLALIISFFIGD